MTAAHIIVQMKCKEVIDMSKNYSAPWESPGTFGQREVHPNPHQTHLCQWPLKLTKVSSVSPYFHKANLLIAADCSAYAYSRICDFTEGKVLTIGCPDLEGEDFTRKLQDILFLNDIQSVQLIRMDAPCCAKVSDAVMDAIKLSGKAIPLQITTVFAEGEDLSD